DANGNGTIDANESDELNDASLGLSLDNVDLALALVKPLAPPPTGGTPPANGPTDTRSWVALKARVGGARLVGIDGLTLAVENVSVAVNSGAGVTKASSTATAVPNTTVIDFSVAPITVTTGAGGGAGQVL